jgi:hypothetical protein
MNAQIPRAGSGRELRRVIIASSAGTSYHLGTGVFGGFTPLIALALTAGTGNQLAGLIFPIAMAAISTLVGVLLLRRGQQTPLVQKVWAQFDRARTRDNTRAIEVPR